ncbi:hypothetical protein P692DRAFT_20850407 [Suillus brevipes Sb2]|nr:hypothetical protein P692DRAFT_20850407 [Suillus brevipes Sb2]
MDHAKKRIIRFLLTVSTMARTDGERAQLVSCAISEAMSMPDTNVTIRTTTNQCQQMMIVWENTFWKLLVMVRSCLALGYSFYPLLDSSLTLVQFRGRVLAALITDTHNPLAFMHGFMVDMDRNVTILNGILKFIWCSDFSISEFLSTLVSCQLEQLNYAVAAIGISHLPFEGNDTFQAIMCHIYHLDGDQKVMFNYQKSHMLSVGDLQVWPTNVLAQLDMMMAVVQ